MKDSLKAGLTYTEVVQVDEGRTISFLGDDLRVYATPSMVEDIEYAGMRLIQQHLDDGEGSVGIHVSVDHLAATPLGEEVTVKIEILEVDGGKIVMQAEVHDAIEMVGKGRHARFVIEVARQAARLRKKQEKMAGA